MKTRTLAMMLMLVVAGLAIGCSSAPKVPPTPVPNFSESEVISLVRDADYRCWYTEPWQTAEFTISDLTHTASASLRPSGIWVIGAKSSWTSKSINPKRGYAVTFTDHGPFECIYVVDDSTGKVTSKAGED